MDFDIGNLLIIFIVFIFGLLLENKLENNHEKTKKR